MLTHAFTSIHAHAARRLYVVNAPYLFTTVWHVIKGWLDPVTVDKIKIISSEKELLDQIPAENLPSTLGGKCTCSEQGGCSLSDAGPWNTPEGKEIIEKVREEEKQKRANFQQGGEGAEAAETNGEAAPTS